MDVQLCEGLKGHVPRRVKRPGGALQTQEPVADKLAQVNDWRQASLEASGEPINQMLRA
jgi:hypothetical protein